MSSLALVEEEIESFFKEFSDVYTLDLPPSTQNVESESTSYQNVVYSDSSREVTVLQPLYFQNSLEERPYAFLINESFTTNENSKKNGNFYLKHNVDQVVTQESKTVDILASEKVGVREQEFPYEKLFNAGQVKNPVKIDVVSAPYKCDFCDYSKPYWCLVDRHMSAVHLNRREFCCEFCGKNYAYKGDLSRHVKQKHCNRAETASFSCIQCGSNLLSKHSLKRHMQYKHGAKKSFVCPVCTHLFIDIYRLKRHVITHQALKFYGCGQCKYAARTFSDLRSHLWRIHNLNPLEKTVPKVRCGACKSVTNISPQMLKYHLKVCHSGVEGLLLHEGL